MTEVISIFQNNFKDKLNTYLILKLNPIFIILKKLLDFHIPNLIAIRELIKSLHIFLQPNKSSIVTTWLHYLRGAKTRPLAVYWVRSLAARLSVERRMANNAFGCARLSIIQVCARAKITPSAHFRPDRAPKTTPAVDKHFGEFASQDYATQLVHFHYSQGWLGCGRIVPLSLSHSHTALFDFQAVFDQHVCVESNTPCL